MVRKRGTIVVRARDSETSDQRSEAAVTAQRNQAARHSERHSEMHKGRYYQRGTLRSTVRGCYLELCLGFFFRAPE